VSSPVLRDETEKAVRQPREPGALGDGGDRPPLLEPREDRAAYQAAQFGALAQHRPQLTQIVGNLIQRFVFIRQIEQRRGVAVGEPGNACALRCHSGEILDILALVAGERPLKFCSDFDNGNPSGGVPPEARGW